MNDFYQDILHGALVLKKRAQKITTQQFGIDILEEGFYEQPLLLAYLNQYQYAQHIPFSNLYFGFQSRESNIFKEVLTNSDGILYLPNLGYYFTNLPNTCLFVKRENDEIILNDDDDTSVNYDFLPIYYLPDTDIEVALYSDPILKVITERDKYAEAKQLCLKSFTEIEQCNLIILHALQFIQEHDQFSLESVIINLQQIFIMDAAYSHNFSAVEYSGAIFLSPPKDVTLIWYVDSLIHETSHINLNLALLKMNEYFAIDPFELKFSSPFRKGGNKRGLYHVVHALFVITNLALFYQKALCTLAKNDDSYWEILGRLLLNIRLLNLGIKTIDKEELYQNKGLILLSYFKKSLNTLQTKNSHLLTTYQIPMNGKNVEHIFSLNDFKMANQLT